MSRPAQPLSGPPSAGIGGRRHVRRAVWMVFALCGALLASAALSGAARARAPIAPLPQHLSETGLFKPGSSAEVGESVIAFAPQYALWSDGAQKRRWIALPPGASIDASRTDAWKFPIGTRLWKEFSQRGRRVETRFIERLADGNWRFAVYVWKEDGNDAVLAPQAGIRRIAVAQAPDGRYDIPSRADCLACHEGAATPVLGFSALQLSADRDPLALHAEGAAMPGVDLNSLVARGVLRHLKPALLARPPRIAAATPVERAALGYLHANCAHCHNHNGAPAPVALRLAQSALDAGSTLERVRRSTVNVVSRYRPPGMSGDARIVLSGAAERSVLSVRMHSRHPQVQMPPIGTRHPDHEGLALIDRWINQLASSTQEKQP